MADINVRMTNILHHQSETDSETDSSPSSETENEESDNELQIVIDRVKSVTIKAPMLIQGLNVKAVVDTGAEVTVLNSNLFFSIPNDQRPALKKAKRNLVVAEAGKEMKTEGMADVSIKLGDTTFEWTVYIAPIFDDLLLGCDIIDEKDITVNTRKGLQIGSDQWITCEVIRAKQKSSKVQVSRAVTIPAYSEFIMRGRCNDVIQEDDTTYVFEATEEAKQHLLVARCVVNSQSNKVPLRMINLSHRPIKLKKGFIIGELQVIGSISSTNTTTDMVNHEEGHSICRLKTYESKHERLRRDTESLPTKMPQTIDERSVVASDLPQHLVNLYQNSSTMLNETQRKNLINLLIKHRETFAKSKTELGKCSVLKHKIETGEAAPVRQPLRRTPQGFEGEEEKYIEEQLAAGAIKPSNSPWSSALVMVRKKTGEVRVCVDYRRLNERTVKDAYPLPRIDMCLDCLSSAKLFSTIDLQSAYMQLELDEEDQPKTAFITKYGLFEYLKMPYGLCNSASTFQRCMELVLRGLQWEILLVYLDDIIVMAQSFDESVERLDLLFDRLSKAGLKIKPSKCELFKTEVLFLGHIVNNQGIRPNPSLVEAVQSWQKPENAKDIQRFIGLASYYRQYVPSFSTTAAPLTKLTRKNAKFVWTDQCETAFQTLKDALCQAPILAYPKPDLPYILDCDASDLGVGGILSQVQEGKERVISYASKRLNQHQEKYSVTRRELLAVITFINHFRHYLLGQKFLLRTDHGSLRWLFEFKEPRGQVARWLEVLAQYDFDIEHRAGYKHANADGMSRRHFKSSTCRHQTEDEEENCEECAKIREEWQTFETEIDIVVDLGVKIANRSAHSHLSHIRVTTTDEEANTGIPIPKHRDTNDQTDRGINTEQTYLPCYTTKEIEELQRQDPDLYYLQQWMDQGELPEREKIASLSPAVRKYWLTSENIVRRKGVLYRKVWTSKYRREYYIQMLAPKVLRAQVIRDHHNTLMSGHLGINKTSRKIRKKFHWYKMDEDIRTHIRKCLKCCAAKHPAKRPKAKQRKYQVGYPLDRVGIDILGPLPITKHKNKYILVIADYFTRYIEAYSIPNQKADTVAEKLVTEFVSRYGTPLELHSDQGRNFESELFKETLKLLEITKTRTTAYRPSSNGLVERYNGTLAKMLMKTVNSNQSDWDEQIGLLLAAYRSTIHPATGYTPNMLMFGREVNLPSHLLFPFPKAEAPTNQHWYVAELRDRMEEVYHLARESLKEAASRQKKDHDTRIAESTFKLGDLVYKKKGLATKLQDLYQGPFVVTNIVSADVYEIQGKKKTSVIHHDRLKLYEPEFVPRWAQTLRQKFNV